MSGPAFLFGNGAVDHLLSTYGYWAVGIMVGIESLGIPVPGETTLIAAALYAGSTHRLSIVGVIAAAAVGAIVGDNVGYAIGRTGGFRLLRRYGRKVRFDERRMKVGLYVFDRHGAKVVFFGRFVSILRTYAAFLAGTMRMSWRRFLAFNAAGGIVWACAYGIGYYAFGSALKGLQTPVDVGIGAAATLIVVGFLVYAKRGRSTSWPTAPSVSCRARSSSASTRMPTRRMHANGRGWAANGPAGATGAGDDRRPAARGLM